MIDFFAIKSLKDLTAQQVYEYLVYFQIPQEIVRVRFLESNVDGNYLSKLNQVPTNLIPEVEYQRKYCEFHQKIIGTTAVFPEIRQRKEENNEKPNNLNSHKQARYQAETPVQQKQMQSGLFGGTRTHTLDSSKTKIPYPAPLPEFSELIENQLHQPMHAIKAIPYMNRELTDFYESNNYALEWGAYKNVCNTLLRKYPILNEIVFQSVMLDYKRNMLSETPKRKRCQEPWSYLSKRLHNRAGYLKSIKRRRLRDELNNARSHTTLQQKQQEQDEQEVLAVNQLKNELNQMQRQEEHEYFPMVDETQVVYASPQAQEATQYNDQLNTQLDGHVGELFYEEVKLKFKSHESHIQSNYEKTNGVEVNSNDSADDTVHEVEEISYSNVLVSMSDSRLNQLNNTLIQNETYMVDQF